nr:MAG: hypothetical protein BECKTC1821D_GA0114238_104713 [Candidatus Kentron sp. TC]VFK60479.1 MAG: hypothetical protein BECKTC1821F_GA0114240_104614 [Candidatus Kentron sp. TC]
MSTVLLGRRRMGKTEIFKFLDEFQNTRLPQAVESPTCPHFVTGSAMSILVREILGHRLLDEIDSLECVKDFTAAMVIILILERDPFTGVILDSDL